MKTFIAILAMLPALASAEGWTLTATGTQEGAAIESTLHTDLYTESCHFLMGIQAEKMYQSGYSPATSLHPVEYAAGLRTEIVYVNPVQESTIILNCTLETPEE